MGAKWLFAWLPDHPLLYDVLAPIEHLELADGPWSLPATMALARGGACNGDAASARAAQRNRLATDRRSVNVGFRVARGD